MAADSAVMVIDAAKGVEPQTRKLFKVCALRDIPIFTFINKMDREARDPFELCEELEQELGIATCPINWPIGSGKEFQGVYDRKQQQDHPLHLQHQRQGRHRHRGGAGRSGSGGAHRPGRSATGWPTRWSCWRAPAAEFDMDAVRHGKLSPVFFGSALTNFGVEPFLEKLPAYDHRSPAPQSRRRGHRQLQRRFLRLCLQDPGQHEQGSPGPHRLHARRAPASFDADKEVYHVQQNRKVTPVPAPSS